MRVRVTVGLVWGKGEGWVRVFVEYGLGESEG